MTTLSIMLLAGCGGNDSDTGDGGGDRATVGETDSALFPELAGWQREEVATYSGEDLYGPIDGEADRFIVFGIDKALFTSYTSGDSRIDVKAFKMTSPDIAYGIFTMYDSPDPDHPIWPNASAVSQSGGSLDFASGQYFVRVSCGEEHAKPAREMAQGMIGNCEKGSDEVPSAVGAMPAGYVEGSLRYFHKWETYRELNYDLSENVLGLSENSAGVQASYTREGESEKDVLLMVFYPGKDDAQAAAVALEAYLEDQGMTVKDGEVVEILDGETTYGLVQARSNEAGSVLGFVREISSLEKARELLGKVPGEMPE